MMTTYHSSSSNINDSGGCAAAIMRAYCYQPRILYASTFVWLTCVGGPFLAPFLKHEGNLSSEQIGTALAIQQICIMLTSSAGGLWADHLEATVCPGRGRAIVIAFGVTMSTLSFLLHGIRYLIIDTNTTTNSDDWYNHPHYHIALQAIYGMSVSLIFPVLDGLTIASLETQNKRQEYGKERLHGPIWWAIANLLLSPFLDKVGFIVCYPLGIVTYIIVMVSLIVYDTGVQQQNTAATTTTTTTNRIPSFSPISPPLPGDVGCSDEDGNYRDNDNENHTNQNHRQQQQKTRENNEGTTEMDGTCHPADATYYDVSTAAATAASPRKVTTSTTSTTMTSLQCRNDEEDSQQQKQKQQPHLSMVQLFRILFITGTNAAFIVCLMCVSSGQAIVDNLAFLFFENLGSSYVLLGCTVVVKIAFEIPVFYYGDYLLRRYGSNTVLVAGSISYFLNALAYTWIPFGAVKYVLLLEPLHGITYGTVQIAMVEFAAKSLPMGYEASGQGIVYFFRELGGVAGLILGGYADAIIGPRTMFRISALVVLVGTMVLVIKMLCVRRTWKKEHATTPADSNSNNSTTRIELLYSYDDMNREEREREEQDHQLQQRQEQHIELT